MMGLRNDAWDEYAPKPGATVAKAADRAWLIMEPPKAASPIGCWISGLSPKVQ